MIEYEEEWLFKLLLRKEGSVFLRSSIFAIPAAALAIVLLYLDDIYPELRIESGLEDVSESQTWSAVTAVLLALLAFRTKQALSRFWEGTGLLHMMRGEWYDSVSCLITFSRAAREAKPAEVQEFRHTLVRLMSLCHGSALQEIQDQDMTSTIRTIDVRGLDSSTLHHLKECKEKYHFNRVEVLLHMTQTLVTRAHDEGVLKIPPPILSRVYQTLSRGFVNLLNAKKITDTRFPFPYAQLIALLLFVHTLLTPMMITVLITAKSFAALVTFLVIFGMFSLNFAASELENPFGSDDNDLPLAHFQNEMNNSLMMLLHTNTDHVPGISPYCNLDFESLSEEVNRKATEERFSESENARQSLTAEAHCAGSPRSPRPLAVPSTISEEEDQVQAYDSVLSTASATLQEQLAQPAAAAMHVVQAIVSDNHREANAASFVRSPRSRGPEGALRAQATLSGEPRNVMITPIAPTVLTREPRDVEVVSPVSAAPSASAEVQILAADRHSSLASSMDSLSESLRKWIGHLEDQVAEMQRNTGAMQNLAERLPSPQNQDGLPCRHAGLLLSKISPSASPCSFPPCQDECPAVPNVVFPCDDGGAARQRI